MIMKNQTLDELVLFENWLTVNGRSLNTRREYLRRVGFFLESSSGDITKETVEQYFLTLQAKSAGTINGYRAAIQSYFEFKDLNIKLPKRSKEVKVVPDYVAPERIVGEIIPWVHWVLHRKIDRAVAVLYLLATSALRKSEVCQLLRENIDLDKLTGRVYRPKTKDWLHFYFTEETSMYIKAYFSIDPQQITNAFNMTEDDIDYIFRKLKKDKCFDDIKLRPHLFRHSLLTYLLKKDVHLKRISEIAGHQSLASTQRYLGTMTEETEKAYHDATKDGALNNKAL